MVDSGFVLISLISKPVLIIKYGKQSTKNLSNPSYCEHSLLVKNGTGQQS